MKKETEVSRCNFLKTGVMAGAAMAGEKVLNKSTDSSNKNPDCCVISQSRTLGSGKHALKVSALGLGMMGMNYHHGPHPDKQAVIQLARFEQE